MNTDYNKILNKYKDRCKINEDLSKYHTFRIKGNADMVIMPESKEELIEILHFCRANDYKHALIGNGSNILFNNGVYNGILIATRKLKAVNIDGDTVYCECGVPLPLAAVKALNAGLSGLEKLSGIPGSLGGAIVMNAGAYGSEIKDVLVSVSVYDKDGSVYDLTPEELQLSYRHSIIKEKGLIVLSCTLKLTPGNYDSIKEIMDICKNKRLSSQPIEFPSAGSIFKKEGEYFPGKLIDDLGLKGFSIGGATVSPKHANFIVNEKNSSASDVKDLITYIQKEVHDKYDVDLKTEVEFL
ncbi:MAG: UDP-N-acetylmuramate dehydrogenase [Clostridium sp.]|nr:UDP-N-acetylmuramate dehydrogenase [Clostridium sp.]